MFLNITAISFGISTILSTVISWRSFLVWKRQKENQVSKAFFQVLLSLTFYMGIRAIASFLFVDFPDILNIIYILSHVYLGIAIAYLAKFAVLNFFNLSSANYTFRVVLALFVSDVILNIFLPNQPHFNPQVNIIEWGTNKYLGIYHTLLLWTVCLGVAVLFIYTALKNWQDRIIRSRSLIMASGVLMSIFVVIPRNVFRDPLFILISDVGYILTFGIILFAINYPKEQKALGSIDKNFNS